MHTFTLENKPVCLSYRKKTTVDLMFTSEPFTVLSQEGPIVISPDTVDDWDGGYFVAYPNDGSKPYAIAPSYVRNNYVPVVEDKREAFE